MARHETTNKTRSNNSELRSCAGREPVWRNDRTLLLKQLEFLFVLFTQFLSIHRWKHSVHECGPSIETHDSLMSQCALYACVRVAACVRKFIRRAQRHQRQSIPKPEFMFFFGVCRLSRTRIGSFALPGTVYTDDRLQSCQRQTVEMVCIIKLHLPASHVLLRCTTMIAWARWWLYILCPRCPLPFSKYVYAQCA